MLTFEIRVAPSTDADCRQCPTAPEYLATSEDGSASVFVDGELVAVSDEYATAYLREGAKLDKEAVEAFLAAAMEFYGRTP